MNQKFSQLNKDYVRSMAWRDDVLLKRSARQGLGGLLVGLFIVCLLLATFFGFKKPLLKHIHQKISYIAGPLEKIKPDVKRVKAKNILHAKQEYGFYTMLPNTEVKSAHHDETSL